MRSPRLLQIVVAAAFSVMASASWAQQQLTIVTSFPKELTTIYKAAFEARNPGVKVEILNRGTSSAIAYTREAPDNNKPDIFWASAPDAFEVLVAGNLLQKFDGKNPAVPAKIGAYLYEPDASHLGAPSAARDEIVRWTIEVAGAGN